MFHFEMNKCYFFAWIIFEFFNISSLIFNFCWQILFPIIIADNFYILSIFLFLMRTFRSHEEETWYISHLTYILIKIFFLSDCTKIFPEFIGIKTEEKIEKVWSSTNPYHNFLWNFNSFNILSIQEDSSCTSYDKYQSGN